MIWAPGSLMPSWAVDNTQQSIKIDTGRHISLCGDKPSYKPKYEVQPKNWRIVGTAICLLSVDGISFFQIFYPNDDKRMIYIKYLSDLSVGCHCNYLCVVV